VPKKTLATDSACRAIACPAGQQTLKAFAGHGLYLLVKPSKEKIWQMAYRIAGKQQTVRFGPYPKVSLAAARSKRDEWRKLLREGIKLPSKSHAMVTTGNGRLRSRRMGLTVNRDALLTPVSSPRCRRHSPEVFRSAGGDLRARRRHALWRLRGNQGYRASGHRDAT
jgi:hypothetical protein